MDTYGSAFKSITYTDFYLFAVNVGGKIKKKMEFKIYVCFVRYTNKILNIQYKNSNNINKSVKLKTPRIEVAFFSI